MICKQKHDFIQKFWLGCWGWREPLLVGVSAVRSGRNLGLLSKIGCSLFLVFFFSIRAIPCAVWRRSEVHSRRTVLTYGAFFNSEQLCLGILSLLTKYPLEILILIRESKVRQ